MSGSKRVLLLMVSPPLPFGNAAARWYYVLLKGLVARGHKVTAIAADCTAEEIKKTRELFPPDRYDLHLFETPSTRSLFSKLETVRKPWSYMFVPELKALFEREAAKGFDVLHLEQLWSGWLGRKYADRALLNVHHFSSIDLEEQKRENFKERLTQSMMFKTEQKLVSQYKYFRACSPRLGEKIKDWNDRANVTVVPVSLDPELYEFIPAERRTREPVLSLFGQMGWYPSYSAAQRLLERLWPEIKKQVPQAKLQIVGWGARQRLRKYVELKDVTIEENVKDIKPYFDRSSVFLYAPCRGSGMKIKILEAMNFGVPVVTTTEGIEGIPAMDGVHAGVADDDDGLIKRAAALLTDFEKQEKQRTQARDLVTSHCGPRATLDAIEGIYGRMEKSI